MSLFVVLGVLNQVLPVTPLLQVPLHRENYRIPDFRRSKWLPRHRRYILEPRLINYNYSYALDIAVGNPGQLFSVAIDTGETDLWIPTVDCRIRSLHRLCKTVKVFDYSESKTFLSHGITRIIPYADGSEAIGTTGSDQITIGSVTVNRTEFVVVNETSLTFEYSPISGMFGLYKDNDFISQAHKQGAIKKRMFTVYMNKHGGAFTIGEEDTNNCHNFAYENDIGSGTYQVKLDHISTSGNWYFNNIMAILDTGTTHIVGSHQLIRAIAKDLGAEIEERDSYPISCDARFRIKIKIGDHTYEIKEDSLMKKYSGSCYLALLGVDYLSDWDLILGIPFFQHHCVAFDLERRTIGFAHHRHRQEGVRSSCLLGSSRFRNGCSLYSYCISLLLLLLLFNL